MQRIAIAVMCLLSFACVGCSRSAPPAPAIVPDQIAAPEVPEHDLLDRFVGIWRLEEDPEAFYEIRPDETGAVILSTNKPTDVTVIINDVYWSENRLQFSMYYYFSFDHPFNGVRMSVSLKLGADEDTMTSSATTVHTEEPFVDVYRRD